MSNLIDTTEMYLKTILELEEDGVAPLRARIVDRLGHSGPTVSQTVARMERDGLLRVGDDRQLELTEEGRTRAIDVVRKHRLAERLLLDVVGLPYDRINDEACRWEHVMSDEVESRLLVVLGDPTTDPFGNPLPNFEGGVVPGPGKSVSAATSGVELPAQFQVVRIGEVLQAQCELMSALIAAGLRPGVSVTVQEQLGRRSLLIGERAFELTPLVAEHLFVTK